MKTLLNVNTIVVMNYCIKYKYYVINAYIKYYIVLNKEGT